MPRLTPSEKQTLTGPVTVGCVLGAFVALASWGFDSEYRHIDHWRMALNALIAFSMGLAVSVVPLGLAPIAIQRLRGRNRSIDDEESE